MMKKILFSLILLFVFTDMSFASNDDVIRLMRTPDYNNGKIVFSYQEDLWVVSEKGGIARRLTVHNGVESNPKFSPDGKWIAFNGNYNGANNNIFIIPSEGGEPKQLTFYPNYSRVVGWTPDSKNIVFTSNTCPTNFYHGIKFTSNLFEISIEGGIPQPLNIGQASHCSFSPDGKKLVYNRHPLMFWWWKRYKGSLNTDVWFYDGEKKYFEKLTNYPGNDSWPMWGENDNIYFVSDRTGISNIFSLSLKDKKITQVTDHNIDGVKWPSIDSSRKIIVYENDARLFKLDLITGKSEEILVKAPSDNHIDMIEYINPISYNTSFFISPTGKRISIEARGDIFTIPAENGDTRNITNSPGIREKEGTWSPNGKYIAYVSDETGEDEIYIIDQFGKEKPIRLTDDKKFKERLLWSPDSKKIIFSTHDNQICFVDINSKKVNKIFQSGFLWMDYNWSPDSEWIVFSSPKKNFLSDIFVYSLKTEKTYQITSEPASYFNPVFTKDGKKLVFLANPYTSLGWLKHIFNKNSFHSEIDFDFTGTKILSVELTPEKIEPYQKEDDEEPIEEVKDKNNKKDSKTKQDKKTPIEVKIDFKDISSRIRALPINLDSCFNLQVADKFYYYQKYDTNDKPDSFSTSLFYYDVENLKETQVISKVLSYEISSNEKKIACLLKGEKIKIIDTGPTPNTQKGDVDLSKLYMKIDRYAEWKQIFNECWRVVRDYFYDPNLHGVNWEEIKEYYSKLIPYVRTRDSLNILLTQMVGELNASHQGLGGGDINYTNSYPVALLGAQFIKDKESGYYKFSKIYKGDKTSSKYRSPLDNDFVKIKTGDFLLKIDEENVTIKDDLYKFLVNKSNKKITLTTNSKPTLEGAIKTIIRPITSEQHLRYKEWLDKNNNIVNEKSNNKIGYIHLQDMGFNDLQTFNKYFQAYRYKEGLIIDVRYNGGGGIDAMLIDKLERINYMTFKDRNSIPLERPVEGFYGPVVVLINEYSFSDAEVFPRAFQIRKLGKVIGVPTLGYCIAVTGHRLIDNGFMRKTTMGIWDLQGKMIESKGVQPDIFVENSPLDEINGIDRQLEKAIEYLLGEIKKNPRKFDYPMEIPKR